jgi:hypothetical protein
MDFTKNQVLFMEEEEEDDDDDDENHQVKEVQEDDEVYKDFIQKRAPPKKIAGKTKRQ